LKAKRINIGVPSFCNLLDIPPQDCPKLKESTVNKSKIINNFTVKKENSDADNFGYSKLSSVFLP